MILEITCFDRLHTNTFCADCRNRTDLLQIFSLALERNSATSAFIQDRTWTCNPPALGFTAIKSDIGLTLCLRLTFRHLNSDPTEIRTRKWILKVSDDNHFIMRSLKIRTGLLPASVGLLALSYLFYYTTWLHIFTLPTCQWTTL